MNSMYLILPQVKWMLPPSNKDLIMFYYMAPRILNFLNWALEHVQKGALRDLATPSLTFVNLVSMAWFSEMDFAVILHAVLATDPPVTIVWLAKKAIRLSIWMVPASVLLAITPVTITNVTNAFLTVRDAPLLTNTIVPDVIQIMNSNF